MIFHKCCNNGFMALYDSLAKQYNQVFTEPSLRPPEWKYIQSFVQDDAGNNNILLDLGCGNGYLGRALASDYRMIIGLDNSKEFIDLAREQSKKDNLENLVFFENDHLDEEMLSSLDLDSVDTVISLLSFRYLDWKFIIENVNGFLKKGGRFLIIDMCKSNFQWKYFGRMIKTWFTTKLLHLKNPGFASNLKTLSQSDGWKKMVQSNPAKTRAEYDRFIDLLIIRRKYSLHDRRILSVSRNHQTVVWLLEKL